MNARRAGALSVISACAATIVSLTPANAAAAGNVAYYGGHVVSHARVVPVMWGSSVAQDVATGAQAFYASIINSPYIDWLGEYDTVGLNGKADNMPGSNQHLNRGMALPTVTITPSHTSKSLADSDIQAELQAQIQAGNLPAPQTDAEGGVDTVYMFSFPPGLSISDFSGSDTCSVSCAYHWTITVSGVSSGVPYGVIPDCSMSARSPCQLGSVLNTFTADASHELTEALTDPECALDTSLTATQRPIAWFDPSQANGEGEIGDLCLSDPTAWVTYQGYLVQKIWSQRLGQCITNDPNLTLCDGHTRPCRPCTASDCSGATPTCDTDMSNETWGQCIAGAQDGGSGSSGSSGGGSTNDGAAPGDAGASGSSGGSGGGGVGSSSGGGSGGSGAGSSSGGGSSNGGSTQGGNGATSSGGSAQSGSAGGCTLGQGGDPWDATAVVAMLGCLVAGVARRRRTSARG